MLTGENGILTQAQNAKEKTTKAEEEEKIKMAVAGSSISNDGLVEMLDETSFKNELKNQFGNQELDVVVNGDGSFIITVKDTNRKYYVNDDKTVINSDNIIEINNEEELKTFRDDVNSGNSYEGKAVLLTSNIDLGGEEWEPIGFMVPDTDTKNPDTEINKPFKGIFEGNNYTISGIYINDESDECYYGIARGEEEKDSSYVGIVYADYYALPDEYTVSFEMKYGGGDIEVLAYENRLNGGNLAVSSTLSDGAFSVVGSDTASCYLPENDRF